MTRYRALQIRPCHRGDWFSHRFETRTPPGPWHPIDSGTPDADQLLDYFKMAILKEPELIGKTLIFSEGNLVRIDQDNSKSRPYTNLTQTFMF